MLYKSLLSLEKIEINPLQCSNLYLKVGASGEKWGVGDSCPEESPTPHFSPLAPTLR